MRGIFGRRLPVFIHFVYICAILPHNSNFMQLPHEKRHFFVYSRFVCAYFYGQCNAYFSIATMLSLPRSHRRAAQLYRAAHFSSIAPPTPKNNIFAAYIHCAAVTWANKTIFSRFWKIDYFCKQTFTNTVNLCVLHFYAKQVNFYCRTADKQTTKFPLFLPKSKYIFVDFTVFSRKIRVYVIL